MRPPSTHSAFTLIELSIVLVIIGLIVGGILVGKDMIAAAQIRATISQFEKFKTAANTFKLKYGDLPGDLTTTEATALGFAPTSRPGIPGVTPGNGLIEGPGGCASYCVLAGVGYETAEFWSDLSQANLIASNIPASTYIQQTLTVQTMSNFVPTASIDGNYWFIYTVTGTQSLWGGSYIIPPRSGTYFHLGGVGSMNGLTNINTSGHLTPIQAANIDTKIDDGVWYTGSVIAEDDANVHDFAPGYINTGSSGVCAGLTRNGAAQTGYHTYDSNATKPGCALSFFFTQ